MSKCICTVLASGSIFQCLRKASLKLGPEKYYVLCYLCIIVFILPVLSHYSNSYTVKPCSTKSPQKLLDISIYITRKYSSNIEVNVFYREDLVKPGKIIFMKISNIYNPLYWIYFNIALFLWNFTKIWNFTVLGKKYNMGTVLSKVTKWNK